MAGTSSPRRLQPTKKVRRLSLLVALSLLVVMIAPASGLGAASAERKNQVKTSGAGDILYYGENGGVSDANNFMTSVNKTIQQATDAGEPLENQFDVTLTVVTKASGTDAPHVTDVLPACLSLTESPESDDVTVDENTITWSLNTPASGPTQEGHSTYTLTYGVVLDNLSSFEGEDRKIDYEIGGTTFYANSNGQSHEFSFNTPVLSSFLSLLLRYKSDWDDLTLTLPDAHFDLYVDATLEDIASGSAQPVANYVSTSDQGAIMPERGGYLPYLYSGHTYRLKETQAPVGYLIEQAPWEFAVAWGEITQLSHTSLRASSESGTQPDFGPIAMSGGGIEVNRPLYNTKIPTQSFVVEKLWVDPAPAPTHPDATFTLYGQVEDQTRIKLDEQTLLSGESSVTFENVPKCTANAEPYTFHVEEAIVDNDGSYYLSSSEPTYDNAQVQTGVKITNRHISMAEYTLRIDRVYSYTLDGTTVQTSVTGTEDDHTRVISPTAFHQTIDTAHYTQHDNRTYSFADGTVTIGTEANQSSPIVAGENVVTVDQTSGYVVTLHYALTETSGGSDSDDTEEEPTPPPVTPDKPGPTEPETPVVPEPEQPNPEQPKPEQPDPELPPEDGGKEPPHIPSEDVDAMDPNAPDSPDDFILVDENDTPIRHYTKQQQPDGSYVYLDENGVPLGEFAPMDPMPQTGDQSMLGILFLLALLSGIGLIMLSHTPYRGRRLQK